MEARTVVTETSWTTDRDYGEPQFITATLYSDGQIYFHDHARCIRGIVELSTREKFGQQAVQKIVMAHYDANDYIPN